MTTIFKGKDFSKRYTEQEADELTAQGFEMAELTEVGERGRWWIIARFVGIDWEGEHK